MTDSDYDNKCLTSWKELFSQIRKRPGLYLGSINLQALQHFVHGFQMAEFVYGVVKNPRIEFEDFGWEDFESSISKFHNERRLSLNSFGLAQFEAQGKDIKTFDLWKEYAGAWETWFRWYDDFVDAKPGNNHVPRNPSTG